MPPSPASSRITSSPTTASTAPAPVPEVKHNVYLNRKTTLSVLNIFHDTNVHIDYPETQARNPIGYLFKQDVDNWQNPTRNFAYSLGRPSGCTMAGEEVYCSLLTDKDRPGVKVPCSKRHMTCQGSKICPAADFVQWSIPHQNPTIEDIRTRMETERENRQKFMDPSHDIFQKTASLITALRKVGCPAPKRENTEVNVVEKLVYSQPPMLSRGYVRAEHCEGRILLEYDQSDQPLIRCEHYNYNVNRDHFVQLLDDSYHIDYLEAYFHEDTDELDRIERSASDLGYGPLAVCTMISNYSSQRAHCPHDHRANTSNRLSQPLMQTMPCNAKYHLYEPLPEYRTGCPWSLVVCIGVHPHPIPIPQKTPLYIQQELRQILHSLDDNLADLTTRRFLRHPILKAHLASRLPGVQNPMLCDLHISLANRSHVKYYIDHVKQENFPHGTGFEGVKHLKWIQDCTLSPEEHYIRRIIEISTNTAGYEGSEDMLRIIICMLPDASKRLAQAAYLQSDIGFKRVVGFYEFEIGTLDRNSNTSITLCRVFLNSETACAHQKVFEAIDDVLKEDTGGTLRWRHIHGKTKDDTSSGMVLLWTADQHRGQAKGLALYLQSIARRQEFQHKYDLHEPDCLLSSLDLYSHLHRVFRLCIVHVKRNIRKLAVSDEVRKLMYTLICIEHDDWDGTIDKIIRLGGKTGSDWVQDKRQSKFAFEAICWQNSYVPLAVWKAGPSTSNLIEAAHADVNREGIHCTLLSGIKKGLAFDGMKLKTLRATESLGIRPSYLSGHTSTNAVKSLKRKFNTYHRELESADQKIEQHNKRLALAQDKFSSAYERFDSSPSAFTQLRLDRARAQVEKQVDIGLGLVKTGSGNVGLVLPANSTI